jgi:hypothetical protein
MGESAKAPHGEQFSSGTQAPGGLQSERLTEVPSGEVKRPDAWDESLACEKPNYAIVR